MKHTTIPPAAWRAIANDPPVDPIAAYAYTRGYPRGLAEVLRHFHTTTVLTTTGTRWEKLTRANWSVELASVETADADAYLATRPDWEKRGEIWYNHVAQARARDGELIVLINYNAQELHP